MQFFATIRKGETTARMHNRAEHDRFIASLAHPDKDVKVTYTVEKEKKKRSINQNDFYWKCISIIRDSMVSDLGHNIDRTTKESVHDMFKALFNYDERVNPATGEIVKVPLSTTILSTVEFMNYFDNIDRWTIEWLGFALPKPGQQFEIDTE